MKKILNIILVATAAVISASCEKTFELERPNQAPWQSVEEFNLAIQSPYLHFTERPWANAIGMMALSGFGEADISCCISGISGDSYYYAYDQRLFNSLVLGSAKELEGAFMYLYDMSTETNAALQFISDAEKLGKDPFTGMSDADRTTMKVYKGELLFQRALTYWYIARKWAPPYNDENKNGKYFVMYRTYVNNPDSLKSAHLTSVEQAYRDILSDLTEAGALLPESYPSDKGSARMRPNKYVAKALKARILFYMGAEANKAEIKTLLDEVINSGLYSLGEPYDAFSKMDTGYGKETIWQICYSSTTERFDRNPGIFNYYAYNTGVYDDGSPKASNYAAFAMSFDALKKIGWEDENKKLTAEALKDKRYLQLYRHCTDSTTDYFKKTLNPYLDTVTKKDPNPYYKADFVFLWKYFRGSSQTAKAERRANRPLIRLADLLLMRAQINLMTGNPTGALDDINAVRKRAGLTDLTSVTEEDIEIERIKEMAGENADRINWLVGLRKDIPVGDRDTSIYEPIKYPYSNMYYQVPVIEQQTNSAYSEK